MDFELPIYPENQAAMKKYMQNQFEFNGVKAPDHHLIERELWQSVKQLPPAEIMQFIETLYARPTREYRYVAIEMALRSVRWWEPADMEHLLTLVLEKVWWDSIDAWRKVFGEYIRLHPEQFDWVAQYFIGAENFWLRRIAITLQRSFYEKTNVAFLEEAILADIDTDEFFIQKAIGWALRNYSKENPEWVMTFVEEHELTIFAQREALKKIKQNKMFHRKHTKSSTHDN